MMKQFLKQWTRKIFYYIVALLFVVYSLIATNFGLQTFFWISKYFMPGTLSAAQLTGSLISPIEFTDFQYARENIHFKSARLIIDLKLDSLLKNTVNIPLLILQDAELKLFHQDPIIIHKASSALKWGFHGGVKEINILGVDAQWKNKPLHIFLGIRLINKKIYFLNNLLVKWGKSQFSIREMNKQSPLQNAALNTILQYEINIEDPAYTGHIQGTLQQTPQHTNWLGNIENMMIQWPIGSTWLSKKSSQFEFSADIFQLDKIELECQNWQLDNFRFKNLHGSLSLAWRENHFKSQFELKENRQNSIHGQIHIDKTVHGFLTGQLRDLHAFYTLFPQISKIKGLIDIEGKLSGTIQKPLLHLTFNAPSVQFLIPQYKIRVSNLNFYIQGNMPGTLSLKGDGSLGEGHFDVDGDLHAFSASNQQNILTVHLKGDHLNLSNQVRCSIVASPDLSIKYEKNKNLILDGTVKIDAATIQLDEQTKGFASSRDVVIVHSKSHLLKKNLPPTFKITPNIQFILENNTHIQGYGLIGTVGGKLQVEERTDGLLVGSGRLTIKEGKYRLQGKNRYIHRGRLLFPQGTLLTDPLLDIKITETKIGEIEYDTDAGIYVQGTLKNPSYQLYSASGMNNTEILSKLGLGIEGVEKEASTKKLSMTKPASLLAGSNPFIDKLSALLGLEELSVTTRETESSQQNLSKTDTVLVIGKWFTDRLYIQYFQSVLEPISTAKMRYRFNKEFTASIESGTEGQGADLIYSIERD